VDTPPATDRAGLRRDAEINRQRVLAAAKELFRERGTEVTLNDIAAHAGVGVATVYRRFANKEELIDALFDDIIEQAAALAAEAAADADAWHGLISSLEKVCEIQAFDRGLRQVMFASERKAHRQAQIRQRIAPAVDQLVARAQEQGTLRRDVVGIDIPMIQLMVAAITDNTGTPDLWRRYLRLLIDGLRARPDLTTLPTVPEPDETLFNAINSANTPDTDPG
jgi:AcrR family transcriptional regulator